MFRRNFSLVTANAVTRSLILLTLILEAIRSFETCFPKAIPEDGIVNALWMFVDRVLWEYLDATEKNVENGTGRISIMLNDW